MRSRPLVHQCLEEDSVWNYLNADQFLWSIAGVGSYKVNRVIYIVGLVVVVLLVLSFFGLR